MADATTTDPIREAVETLIAKLDAMHADPRYQGVWTLAHVHGMPYTGPDYGQEFKAVKAALLSASQPSAPVATDAARIVDIRDWVKQESDDVTLRGRCPYCGDREGHSAACPLAIVGDLLDLLTRAEQARHEAEQPRDDYMWRPIDTAPKDGNTIVGYTPNATLSVGDVFWWAEQEQWARLPDHSRVRPTHWLPLRKPMPQKPVFPPNREVREGGRDADHG